MDFVVIAERRLRQTGGIINYSDRAVPVHFMVRRGKKEESIIPADSRCGIVETYRNASAKPGGTRDGTRGGGDVRV